MPGHCAQEGNSCGAEVATQLRVSVIILFQLTKTLGAMVVVSGGHSRGVWTQLIRDRWSLPGESRVELPHVVQAANRGDCTWDPGRRQPARIREPIPEDGVAIEKNECAGSDIEAVPKDGVVGGAARSNLGRGLTPVTRESFGYGRLYTHFDRPRGSSPTSRPRCNLTGIR
jgi:hypothetical protein